MMITSFGSIDAMRWWGAVVIVVVIVVVSISLVACSSRDDDENGTTPWTVPESFRSENATFQAQSYFINGVPFDALVIRLSDVDFCDARSVPAQKRVVAIKILTQPGKPVLVASYPVSRNQVEIN